MSVTSHNNICGSSACKQRKAQSGGKTVLSHHVHAGLAYIIIINESCFR